MTNEPSSTVFSLQGERLEPLASHGFDDEGVLQQLLADNAELIAAAVGLAPGSCALIKREAGVPREQGGVDWYSLDHLFVTVDAIPVLVEVKRASDSRIRREVVGQMLDYAANGTRFWPAGQLRRWFEERHHDGPPLVIQLGTDLDPETFWSDVDMNLAAGRVHLLFVADELPDELKAVVQFLSTHFADIEVSAAEVRQFGTGGNQVVAVERFQPVGSRPPRPPKPTFDEAMAAATPEFQQLVDHVRAWARDRHHDVNIVSKSLRVTLPSIGPVIYLYPTYDYLEFRLDALASSVSPDFAEEVARQVQSTPGGSRSAHFASIRAAEAVQNWNHTAALLNELMNKIAASTTPPSLSTNSVAGDE